MCNKTKILILMMVFSSFLTASDKVYHVRYEKKQENAPVEKAQVFYGEHCGFYMIIDEPVYQCVRITAARSTYIFPQEQTVIIFKNKSYGLLFPSIELFFNVGKNDYGLSQSGFSLDSHSLKGDSLITQWSVKGDKKSQQLYMTVYRLQNAPVKIESFDNKRKLKKRMLFSGWEKKQFQNYPMNVTLISEKSQSEFSYKDLQILETLPDSLETLFSYDETWKLYEYSW